jgi:hypothetical protein
MAARVGHDQPMRFWIQQAILLATGVLCFVIGALWTCLLLFAAILGLSAMPDDLATTQNRLEQLFVWLLRQDPSAASFAAAGFVMLFGLFVVGYFWSRAVSDYRDRNRQTTTSSDISMPRPRVGARPLGHFHHSHETIELYQLRTKDNPKIENRIFENCSIVGPVVLLPKKTTLLDELCSREGPLSILL